MGGLMSTVGGPSGLVVYGILATAAALIAAFLVSGAAHV